MTPEPSVPSGRRYAAGVLLTGGTSARMGRDKATMKLPGEETTLAQRTGQLLASAVAPCPALEVGPGVSGLPTASDLGVLDPGTGPLTAVLAGAEALSRSGFKGPVVVVATDLPLLSAEVLAFLVGHPGTGSVVPVVAGRPQPLLARWARSDLEHAAELGRLGERSLRGVFGPDTSFVSESEWAPLFSATVFSDIDTPSDLGLLITPPVPGAPPRGGRSPQPRSADERPRS
jgi:molybdopterin-guanine dinucleotide biosynthesis protein A